MKLCFLYTKMYTTEMFVWKIATHRIKYNVLTSPFASRPHVTHMSRFPKMESLLEGQHHIRIVICEYLFTVESWMVWSCWMLPLSCRCRHFVPVHICVHSHEATEHTEHMGRVSSGCPASLDGLGSLYRRPRHGCTGSCRNFVFLAVSSF